MILKLVYMYKLIFCINKKMQNNIKRKQKKILCKVRKTYGNKQKNGKKFKKMKFYVDKVYIMCYNKIVSIKRNYRWKGRRN